MSSKSNGANHGARRVVKATAFSPKRTGKPPKKKPVGYEDEEDNNNSDRS
jgi:hypothetical protein